MTTATKGTLKRSIKRALRALAYAYIARWLQKHGISIPVPEIAGALVDPGALSGAAGVAGLMGADKAIREKWRTVKAWLVPGD